MMKSPEIRYARSGEISIAYQVVGDGPVDIVFVPFIANLVYWWELPPAAEFFARLASFSRLIVLDKRGTGLSDRPRELPTLEVAMDDIRAVLDDVGSDSAVVLGSLAGCQLASVFAATYPERTRALVLFHPSARSVAAPDYPWGPSLEDWHRQLREIRDHWGERPLLERFARTMMGPLADDETNLRWGVTFWQLSASPGAAHALYRMLMQTDVRDVLPAISAPTLVLYRQPQEGPARYVAGRIPGATAMSIPGTADGIIGGAAVADETERFLRGLASPAEPERVLTTVLFTDLVGSSERAVEVGDRAWRDLLNRHHGLIRQELLRFRGRELDNAGDGFLASFDGPARGIRCAQAIVQAVRGVGLEIRAGLHTGECELLDGKVAGIAVHTGARVASHAAAGEVLVSSTVKDLVAGSGLAFQDRGTHELKGVPGEWRLFAVQP